jgi:hypothetical protein
VFTVLSDENGAYYTVIRPSASTDLLAEWAQTVMEYPAKHQNKKLNLPWKSDNGESIGAEILLGFTNRPETREVMESIGYDDFAIVSKGDKIVVAAHREERLREAFTYFYENLLKIKTDENGKASFVYTGDYTFVSDRKFLFDSQNSLRYYSIVYRADSEIMKASATELQAKIKEACGAELSVKSDAEIETDCEIVLGMTNREISQKHFKSAYSFSSLIVNEGKKILIGSPDDSIAARVTADFATEYIEARYSYTFNLEAGINVLDTGFDFSESPVLAEGAETRIMSFNILCELWDSKAVDVESRMQIVMATLLTYTPDVVGL